MLSILTAAGWPIWLLVACSILALALVIERFVSLQPARVLPPKLLDDVIAATRNGPPSLQAVDQLEKNSVLGSVLAGGLGAVLQHHPCQAEDIQAGIERAGRRATHQLERYLSALATIASVAPLLGLFGTVIGMIEIFGSQAPTVGGANPAQLAHGISVALYNTAFGLMVAVPSLIFWRYFRSRVDAYVLALELAGEQLARHLTRLATPQG